MPINALNGKILQLQPLTYKPTGHWSGSDRAYKPLLVSLTYQKRGIRKLRFSGPFFKLKFKKEVIQKW